MKLSVIVPIYNAEKFLNQCIESLVNQTYKDFEIVLVNDGSKDNSLAICESYAKNDKRIKIISQENKGISGAVTYEVITAERDGSETWDKSMQTRMEDAVLNWVKIRNNWIVGLSDSFKKIEDPSFKEAILPLCKRNEEFTNSVASNANKIADALNELGISLDKFIGATAETASSAAVGAVNVKVDLSGADV